MLIVIAEEHFWIEPGSTIKDLINSCFNYGFSCSPCRRPFACGAGGEAAGRGFFRGLLRGSVAGLNTSGRPIVRTKLLLFLFTSDLLYYCSVIMPHRFHAVRRMRPRAIRAMGLIVYYFRGKLHGHNRRFRNMVLLALLLNERNPRPSTAGGAKFRLHTWDDLTRLGSPLHGADAIWSMLRFKCIEHVQRLSNLLMPGTYQTRSGYVGAFGGNWVVFDSRTNSLLALLANCGIQN